MSQSRYKPDGYHSVQPYLIVTGADELAAFARAAFDAEILERHLTPAGTVRHGAMRIGDSIIEFAEGSPAWPVAPSTDHDYGERSGGVKDPCGNSWFIATLRP